MDNGETAEQAASRPRDATTSGVPAEELIPEEEEEGRAPSELEVLQGEMALLEQQLQQMRDRYIRAAADLENARKRARQAIGEARQQAIAGVLQELLPLLDNFERALESSVPAASAPAETQAVYDGIELIYRQLKQVLERRGVKPIEALGQPFDPHLHEAVVQVPAGKEHPEGTVALEMQRGYTYGDQVLRHSQVGVAVREAGRDKRTS
jgi:molecular chaperone GrpE